MRAKRFFSIEAMTMPCEGNNDIIQVLVCSPFKVLPVETKLEILTVGRPRPNLSLLSRNEGKAGPLFNVAWYDTSTWLCGSSNTNRLFCWPCLLMRPDSSSWASTGSSEFRKILSLTAKHSSSKMHLKAVAEYNAAMEELGLESEIIAETKVENLETESESDTEFLRRFLVPKSNDSLDKNDCNASDAKTTLTFRAWQQEKESNNRVRSSSDPIILRRRRRLARIELKNAKLSSRVLQLEIALLESKLEYQRALNGNLPCNSANE